MDTATLRLHIEGDHCCQGSRFFHGMIRTAHYQFDVPETVLVETIESLERFVRFMQRPVTVYGKLIVHRDQPTEMEFRSSLRTFLDKTSFGFWNAEKQQEKREAMTNLIAAQLQLAYPSLEFSYCQALAADEIALDRGEKAVMRTARVYLQIDEHCLELFRGGIDMETQDGSGFGIRLAPSDVFCLKSYLENNVGTGLPVQLIVDEKHPLTQ